MTKTNNTKRTNARKASRTSNNTTQQPAQPANQPSREPVAPAPVMVQPTEPQNGRRTITVLRLEDITPEMTAAIARAAQEARDNEKRKRRAVWLHHNYIN